VQPACSTHSCCRSSLSSEHAGPGPRARRPEIRTNQPCSAPATVQPACSTHSCCRSSLSSEHAVQGPRARRPEIRTNQTCSAPATVQPACSTHSCCRSSLSSGHAGPGPRARRAEIRTNQPCSAPRHSAARALHPLVLLLTPSRDHALAPPTQHRTRAGHGGSGRQAPLLRSPVRLSWSPRHLRRARRSPTPSRHHARRSEGRRPRPPSVVSRCRPAQIQSHVGLSPVRPPPPPRSARTAPARWSARGAARPLPASGTRTPADPARRL